VCYVICSGSHWAGTVQAAVAAEIPPTLAVVRQGGRSRLPFPPERKGNGERAPRAESHGHAGWHAK
jgi:hypothetical protein